MRRVSLWLALFLAAAVAPAPAAPLDLRLVYHSGVAGELDPCG